MPDDVNVTDATLVEAVAQTIFENWAFYPGDPQKPDWHPNGNSTRQDDARFMARAAIAALQPTLSEAREAGRREGLEQAAQICETERLEWVTSGLQGSEALAAAYCRRAIRALIPATELGRRQSSDVILPGKIPLAMSGITDYTGSSAGDRPRQGQG